MDTKKFLIGSVVGGIVMWLVGMLIWRVLLADFFTPDVEATTGLIREAPIYWAGILGTLGLSALVTTAIAWAGSFSLRGGFQVGAIVGFLVWFGVDFIHYANQDFRTLWQTIVDPLLELVRTGIGGAVIGLVLAKFGGEGPASSA